MRRTQKNTRFKPPLSQLLLSPQPGKSTAYLEPSDSIFDCVEIPKGFTQCSQIFQASPGLNRALNESSLRLDTPSPARPSQKRLPTPISNDNNKAKKSRTSESLDDDDSMFIALDENFHPQNRTQKVLSKINSGSVLFSQETGAHYVKRQRSMVNKNEENVIDDEVSISQYNSQYTKDVENEFNECEKSILQKGSPVLFLDGISRINWEESMNIPQQDTESAFGRVQLAPVSSATFSEIGPFFGLPTKVKTLVQEFKGIDELYDWQKECLRLKSVLQRDNLIYALPTSGGKTLVAEILMLREVMCRRKNVLFILPFVSIVQEKILALSPFAVHFEFLVEEYAAGKGTIPPRKRRKKNSIFIATIEKGLALLDGLIAEDRAGEIGLIVVDELHLLGEKGRGGTLESLLTKAMMTKCGIQIIGMSATIGNLGEVADFLNADVYTRDFRPVELKEYIKVGLEIFAINNNAPTPEEAFIPERTLDFAYNAAAMKQDQDYLAGLVNEIIPKESCLVFCPTKKNCENVAQLLCRMLHRDLLAHREEEKTALLLAIERDVGDVCPILRETIPYGIAYHHSGLTSDERKHLEDAYRIGILCVICCTSTLAAGVNLPAKRVILRSPYVGKNFINLSKYKQMVGRAGRAGQTDCGESFLICNNHDLPRVSALLFQPMDEAISSLSDSECLQPFLLSLIELGLAPDRDTLQKVSQSTLLSVQAKRLNINLKKKIDETLKGLYKQNALSVSDGTNTKTNNVTVIIESSQEISQSTSNSSGKSNKVQTLIKGNAALEISRLGKAAIKACVSLSRAETIYADLREAQKHLVLTDHLHLLYLATPYDTAETVFPDARTYHNAYLKLSRAELVTATVIGLTEARARSLYMCKKFDVDLTRKLNRFFVTLVLYDLWRGRTIHDTHLKFNLGRGTVQALMQNAASQAASVYRFCEELDEFWPFKQLFEVLTKRLQHCCAIELMPLMELPAVKLGRAKQLYNAGYKRMENIVAATPDQLVKNVEHLNYKVAKQLISAAKALLLERVEDLRGEMNEVMENLK